MGRSPLPRDQVDRTIRTEADVRVGKVRPQVHTETKTFIVPGLIDTLTVIPPCRVSVIRSPEWKQLIRFDAILTGSGTCTLEWKLGDDVLLSGHDVTTSDGGDAGVLPAAVEIPFGGAWLTVTVTNASGAADLSAAFTLITNR